MKQYLAAVALAAALAQPATATTFPTLTTIYIGAGVTDDGAGANVGIATTFLCSNVSGVTTSIRFLVLNDSGGVEGQQTFNSVAHGSTATAGTHDTVTFVDISLGTGFVGQGVINIESTQSGVFCNAVIIDADATPTFSVPLGLVRVNPHPGTVE